MAKKFNDLIKNKRIILLLAVLLISLILIMPFPKDGVAIRGVEEDSYASDYITVSQGRPMSKEVISKLDEKEIGSVRDYYDYLASLSPNSTVRVETNRDAYRIKLNSEGDLGLAVVDAPFSNIRKGLDLEGGSRVLLKPVDEVSETLLSDASQSLELRLNAFGLSNVIVRKVTTPEQYIIVELAGTTKEEVKDLLLKQGKFEAKILNETVIDGKEVERVGKTASEARLEGCNQNDINSYSCSFVFSLRISKSAADKFAESSSKLDVVGDSLSSPLSLYLDDELISNLSISSGLKGQKATQISISGGESGSTEREARDNALSEMKNLQTILESGSLPIKLEIAETETISPILGKEFTDNTIKVGLIAIFSVALVIFGVYRKLKIVLPMVITMISEIFLILGVAAAFQWQLDLAAIAGIIIAAGTGVDDQIVIISEILKGEKIIYNWKEKVKKAFFIIMGSYFTTVVATIPLFWAGAGLLKGFAFATIAGISIGVFITRPAYAAVLEWLMKD